MAEHFESVFKTYSELREYVNNYTFAIPSTFFSLYQQKLDAFVEHYNKQKDQAIPKKKFAFKKKDKNIAKKAAEQGMTSMVDQKYKTDGNHLYIKSLQNQNHVVKAEEYEGKENIILEDLENCEVLVPFVVKCLYVKNIKNCEVKMSAVSGASFIDFAVGCEIFMATHQLRIHNSTDTNFLIIARSNPIIEHCSTLGFGNLKETDFG